MKEFKKELDVNVVARWMCIKYMLAIEKAKIAFKDFLEEYEDKNDLGFEFKIEYYYIFWK